MAPTRDNCTHGAFTSVAPGSYRRKQTTGDGVQLIALASTTGAVIRVGSVINLAKLRDGKWSPSKMRMTKIWDRSSHRAKHSIGQGEAVQGHHWDIATHGGYLGWNYFSFRVDDCKANHFPWAVAIEPGTKKGSEMQPSPLAEAGRRLLSAAKAATATFLNTRARARDNGSGDGSDASFVYDD